MTAILVRTVPAGCLLGESAIWDGRVNAYYLVDILGREVLRWRWGADACDRWRTPGQACAVALTHDPHVLLVALEERLCTFDLKREVWRCLFERPADGLRFNDGRIDPHGRLVIGTMADPGWAEGATGKVYVFDGALRCVLDQVRIPNGIAWSVDGASMYFTDSPTQRIERFAYDARGGVVGSPAHFATLSAGVHGDGACTDTADGYWIAQWGGGCVTAFDQGGALIAIAPVPTPQPACVAFGGPDLSYLLVTTAAIDLRDDSLGAGDLFLYETSVTGLPCTPFGAI